MPARDVMGPGWWLDPDNLKLYLVTRHELWLADPANLKAVRLRQEFIDKILALDPEKDSQEMKILACQGGLIRIRDYTRRLSIEFYAPRFQVRPFLWSVFMVLDKISRSADTMMTFANLYNAGPNGEGADTAMLWRREFVQKMKADEPILRERQSDAEWAADIREVPAAMHESLRRLLGESPRNKTPVSLRDAANMLDAIRNDRTDSVESKISQVDMIGAWLANQQSANTKFLSKLLSEVHFLRDKLEGGTGKGGTRIEFQ